MTHYYRQVSAWLDPEQSDPLRGGGWLQDVCILLTESGEHEPAAIAMLAGQARELAFELLALAEQADRQRTQASS